MNTRMDFIYRSWKAPINLKPARPIVITKIGLVVMLATGVGFTTLAQSFYNLDFEQASLIPVSGGYAGEVLIGPALPGWSVFIQEPFVLYDNMFLDSAGVSIFDSLMGAKACQGNFSVILQGGFSLYSGPPDRLSSAIAQTGLIPTWAKTLLFDAWVMDPAYFTVSLGPFDVLATYTNYSVYAVDVSGLAGQTVVLAFTAFPRPPPGDASNDVWLDDIRFSSSPPSYLGPAIEMPPQNQTADVGSTVDFLVGAVAPSPLAYQWFFNGTNVIIGATTPDLQLTNVQLTQSGFYTVVVTNAFGAVTSAPATLTVTTSPPWILTPPLSQSANVAAAIDFTVSAQGSLPLTYQWFFNNNAISGAGTTHLHLDNLQPSQAGAYTAVVTNAFGSATSPPAMLTVIAIPPTIERSPRSATTIPGGFADFTVSAAGSPPLSYQWFFNGSAILAASSAELYLTNVHVAQSGTYSVVVTNAFGAITSGPAILTVLETPPNHPTGTVVAWGDQVIPYALPGTRFTAIAAGGFHNLALKRDGTVAAWGDNEWGVSILPAGFTGVIAISTAEAQSLALKSDGTVVAWGYNPSGNHTVPTGLSGVIAIAQGGGNSLALRADGKVIAWGANDYGQGSVPGDLTGVVAISAGGGHNLALKSDGTVVAWGYNEFGQTNVPPGLRGVIAITAGALFHSLALKSDGTVVAWGYNAYGQANVPAGLSHVTAIAAGRYHNLALKSDGTVVAWGDNSYGQSMVPAGLTKVIALAAGDIHSLALRSDGTVVVWGDNTYGQSMAPAALTNFIALAAGAPFSGSGHTLALKSDGTVVAWGDDEFGQASVPSGLSNVVGIAAGLGHSLALMFDGTVEAWGYDSYGEADVPAGLRGVSAIAAGGYFSLALKSDGTVVAWGSNSHGETNLPAGLIGVTAIAAGGGYGGGHGLALKSDGTVAAWGTYDQSTVPADLTDVAAVAAGQYHSLALKSNGTVVAWGDNGVGQTNVPANLRGVVAIAAGGIQSLGLKSNDEVVAWGGDYSGETNVPAALTDVIAIAAGAGLSLALVSESPTLQSLPAGQTAEIGSTVQFRAGAGGCPPLAYQWLFNNATATTSSTTNCVLPLTNVQPAQAGAYTVVVTNAFGAVTSAPAMLSVIPAVERRMVPALSLFSQPGSSLNLEGADAFGPSPTWATFNNVLLTNTSQWYFDLSTPLPPQRFYRAWQSGPSSLAPALDLHVVPALTLTGAIGKAVRVDYINQFGPTDAWVTLDTVTLTNSWQLYFDLSAIGQAPRLWRLTTVP